MNKTYELLHHISSHLSNRSGFSKLEYLVCISETRDIRIDPVVSVFPNIHNKKQSDKELIIYHILTHHMKDIEKYKEELLPGNYVYKLDTRRKRRTWMRVITDGFDNNITEIRVTK